MAEPRDRDVRDVSGGGEARQPGTVGGPLQAALALGLDYEERLGDDELKAAVAAAAPSGTEGVAEAVDLVVRLRTAAGEATERAWPRSPSDDPAQAFDREIDQLKAAFPAVPEKDVEWALTLAIQRHAIALSPEEGDRTVRLLQEIYDRPDLHDPEKEREFREVVAAIESNEGYQSWVRLWPRLSRGDRRRINDWLFAPASMDERTARADRVFDWAIGQERNGTADVVALVDG